jgi:hypothetical protein
MDSTTIHSVPNLASQYVVTTEPLSHGHGDVIRSFDSSVADAVYIFYPGPSFPTPAEVNIALELGCDAVGMTSPLVLLLVTTNNYKELSFMLHALVALK